jgi:hypothetical protein
VLVLLLKLLDLLLHDLGVPTGEADAFWFGCPPLLTKLVLFFKAACSAAGKKTPVPPAGAAPSLGLVCPHMLGGLTKLPIFNTCMRCMNGCYGRAAQGHS